MYNAARRILVFPSQLRLLWGHSTKSITARRVKPAVLRRIVVTIGVVVGLHYLGRWI